MYIYYFHFLLSLCLLRCEIRCLVNRLWFLWHYVKMYLSNREYYGMILCVGAVDARLNAAWELYSQVHWRRTCCLSSAVAFAGLFKANDTTLVLNRLFHILRRAARELKALNSKISFWIREEENPRSITLSTSGENGEWGIFTNFAALGSCRRMVISTKSPLCHECFCYKLHFV